MMLFSSKYARFSEMGAGASGVILWGKNARLKPPQLSSASPDEQPIHLRTHRNFRL
jgi:hypothetical protein